LNKYKAMGYGGNIYGSIQQLCHVLDILKLCTLVVEKQELNIQI
jgi:hypothetical protein